MEVICLLVHSGNRLEKITVALDQKVQLFVALLVGKTNDEDVPTFILHVSTLGEMILFVSRVFRMAMIGPINILDNRMIE